MATIYHEQETDVSALAGQKIAVLGFGSQGHAHAQNLKDSGHDVRVGLRPGSSSRAKAEEAGLRVLDTPDYVKLAEAYGAVGLRVEHPAEVDAAIEKAMSIEDRSVVIDFRVDSREMCFPMVPAGASNDAIITGPEGLKPQDDPAEAPIA